MPYNAINPSADEFYRGVISHGGARSARGFRTVKDPPGTDGFVHPFILPPTPELPIILPTVISYGVEMGIGGGVTPPTYAPPTLAIVASATTGEAGSLINLVITPAWVQKDAGAVIEYRLSVDSTVIHTAPSPAAYTISGFEFTDTAKQIRGHADYGAGPIKLDSGGDPYPLGQIMAGTINSNILGLTGFRKAFYACFSSQVSTPTTSSAIRAYVDTVDNVASTKQVVINAPAGTHDVICCYPASVGNTIDVRQASFDMFSIHAAFARTIVSVEGANSYMPVAYHVCHMTNASPYTSSEKFTLTITD